MALLMTWRAPGTPDNTREVVEPITPKNIWEDSKSEDGSKELKPPRRRVPNRTSSMEMMPRRVAPPRRSSMELIPRNRPPVRTSSSRRSADPAFSPSVPSRSSSGDGGILAQMVSPEPSLISARIYERRTASAYDNDESDPKAWMRYNLHEDPENFVMPSQVPTLPNLSPSSPNSVLVEQLEDDDDIEDDTQILLQMILEDKEVYKRFLAESYCRAGEFLTHMSFREHLHIWLHEHSALRSEIKAYRALKRVRAATEAKQQQQLQQQQILVLPPTSGGPGSWLREYCSLESEIQAQQRLSNARAATETKHHRLNLHRQESVARAPHARGSAVAQ